MTEPSPIKKQAKTNYELQKRYRERHADEIRQRKKDWYEKNKQEILLQKAKRRIENKEQIQEKTKEKREKERLMMGFTKEQLEEMKTMYLRQKQTIETI